ncbi:SGNH/GDSL hydrolase family protein, partial [Streptomyces spiramenti]|nr:SGNH/GDSL hydrolase family protein [Streptomyces spiramenti]
MAGARVARRIATAAALGGGGIGVVGGVALGVLLTEAQLARRQIGVSEETPPVADGRYGAGLGSGRRPPLRLGFLGDSTAAGLGVQRAAQTPAALVASGLAAVAERPVELRNVALSGAESTDLARQVSLLLADTLSSPAPDVCVIMIGANDVTGHVSPATSVRCLSEAVTRLRSAGARVVVATCPDLGTIEPVAQPLRWVARRLSRQLAAAQTIAVVELGGRTVSLGDLLGPEFAANPREMFGPDRYHPSAEGYATAAMALLPTVCAVMGVWPEPERMEPARRESVLSVERAAVRAAKEGGTEVASDADALRAPWALLKHRRRRRIAASEPERSDDRAADASPEPGARRDDGRDDGSGDTGGSGGTGGAGPGGAGPGEPGPGGTGSGRAGSSGSGA